MASLTDYERATLRVRRMGWANVKEFVRWRIGKRAHTFIVILSRGLRTRRAMEGASAVFGVPPTYWMEANLDRIEVMAKEPAPAHWGDREAT